MAAAFMSRKPSVNHVTLVIFLEFFAWGSVTRSSPSQTTLSMTRATMHMPLGWPFVALAWLATHRGTCQRL